MADNVEFEIVPAMSGGSSGEVVEITAPDGEQYAWDTGTRLWWWLDSNRGHRFAWDGQSWQVEAQTDDGDLADCFEVDVDWPPTIEDVQDACRQWLHDNPGLIAQQRNVSPIRRAVSWVRSWF